MKYITVSSPFYIFVRFISSIVKFVNILKYSNKKTVLHLQNINILWNLNSNRLEEYGYAGLFKALKHKYKYALSTNLPCISRHSQFLPLLCIFAELISLQESCRSRFRLSSRLFGCLKCSLLLIVRHILEIRNDHPWSVSHGSHTPGTLDFANAFLFPV